MSTVEPFVFYSRLNLLELTGRTASTAAELLAGIRETPDASVFHHTHRHLDQRVLLSPEPPNDFAEWVTHMLGDALLGEKLAAIDISRFSSIGDLRQALVQCFDAGGAELPEPARRTPTGLEFQFIKAVTFILPTGCVASDLSQFLQCMQEAPVHSLYYHIFDAKLSLQKGINDFSRWLEEGLGEVELAQQIDRLDPYTHTMEGLRSKICSFIRQRLEVQHA